MNPKQLFSFEDLASGGDKVTRAIIALFEKSGRAVASASIDAKIKKTSGIAFREICLGMGDNQTVFIRVNETGDIYQVLLNKRILPIHNQTNQAKAIEEIIKAVIAGAAKHQALTHKMTVIMPKSSAVRTSTPNKIIQLTTQRDELKTEIEAVNAEILAMAV